MKKTFIIFAAIVAAFACVSCEKETSPSSNGQTTIKAVTESSLSKAALSGNDAEGYDVVWNEGDIIMISGNEYTLESGAGSKSATFVGPEIPATARFAWYAMTDKVNWTLPSTQTYTAGKLANVPMQANFSSYDPTTRPLEFKNIFGLLRLTIKSSDAAKVSSITISSDQEMAGAFSVSNDVAYITTKPEYSVTLDCGEEGVEVSAEGKDFYFALPQGEYSNVKIVAITTDGRYSIKKLKSSKTLDIKRAQITPASFTATFIVDGALPGVFSVSETKQVYFSQGNLYCDLSGDTPKWAFYEKQGGHQNEYDPNIVSLFTFGYNPEKSIVPDGCGCDNVDIESGNLSQSQDWGAAIDDKGTWRSLTSDEWNYLFFSRTVNGGKGEKHSYQTGVFRNGVYGIAIYPDDYTGPALTNERANIPDGVVFLPVSGLRYEGHIHFIGERAFYWTSTAIDSAHAYELYFNSGAIFIYDDTRDGGNCVRLVTDK